MDENSQIPVFTCESEDCASDLCIDQLLAGELSAHEAAEVRGRLEACAGCLARLEARSQGFAAFPEYNSVEGLARIKAEVDPDKIPPAVTAALNQDAPQVGHLLPGPLEIFWSWWHKPVARFAMVGALTVLMAVSYFPLKNQLETGTRLKGTPVMKVYRLDGDQPELVSSGSEFKAGQKLKFEILISKI